MESLLHREPTEVYVGVFEWPSTYDDADLVIVVEPTWHRMAAEIRREVTEFYASLADHALAAEYAVANQADGWDAWRVAVDDISQPPFITTTMRRIP